LIEPGHVFISEKSPLPMKPSARQLWQWSEEKLIAELRRIGGTDEKVFGFPELLKVILPAIRADYKIIGSWSPAIDQRLGCPVTVLAGTSDACVSPDSLKLWSRHASGPFDIRFFPGGHFYVYEHAPQLMKFIEAALGFFAIGSTPS